MMLDFPIRADYLLARSYMYRRLNLPRQAYQLRRMASWVRVREASA